MKRSRFLFMFAVVLIFIPIVHTTGHFYFFGTGIQGFRETGLSGLSVGERDVGEDATGIYSIDSSISQIIVIGEWIAVFMFMIIAFARSRSRSRDEFNELKISLGKIKGERDTDLDKLYGALQERKRIGFGVIAKAFNVHGKVVHEWAKILESGKLANIDYPRVGDPEIVLVEKEK